MRQTTKTVSPGSIALQRPGDGSESYIEGGLVPTPVSTTRPIPQARLWASQEHYG